LYTAVAEMKHILQNDGEGCGKSIQMIDRWWLYYLQCGLLLFSHNFSLRSFVCRWKATKFRDVLDFQEGYFQNTQDENTTVTVEISHQSELNHLSLENFFQTSIHIIKLSYSSFW